MKLIELMDNEYRMINLQRIYVDLFYISIDLFRKTLDRYFVESIEW